MVLVVVDISVLLLLLVVRRHCVPRLRSQPRRYSNKLSTPTTQPLIPADQQTRLPPNKVRALNRDPRKLHRGLNKTSPPATNKAGIMVRWARRGAAPRLCSATFSCAIQRAEKRKCTARKRPAMLFRLFRQDDATDAGDSGATRSLFDPRTCL
jgi:hypothetical protein